MSTKVFSGNAVVVLSIETFFGMVVEVSSTEGFFGGVNGMATEVIFGTDVVLGFPESMLSGSFANSLH